MPRPALCALRSLRCTRVPSFAPRTIGVPTCRTVSVRAFSTFNSSLKEWNDFNTSGLKYLSDGQLPQAESQFIAALRVSSQLMLDRARQNSIPLYLSLSNLSTVQRMLGKLGESKKNATLALNHARSMTDKLGLDTVGHLYRELGLVCEMRSEYNEALDCYKHAEASYRHNLDTRVDTDTDALRKEHSGCLYAIALMNEMLDNDNTALDYYTQALEHASAVYDANSVNIAELHVSQGKLLLKMGQAANSAETEERGRESLMSALEIYQQHKDPKLLEVLKLYLDSMEAMSTVKELLALAKKDVEGAAKKEDEDVARK